MEYNETKNFIKLKYFVNIVDQIKFLISKNFFAKNNILILINLGIEFRVILYIHYVLLLKY